MTVLCHIETPASRFLWMSFIQIPYRSCWRQILISFVGSEVFDGDAFRVVSYDDAPCIHSVPKGGGKRAFGLSSDNPAFVVRESRMPFLSRPSVAFCIAAKP
jgi:hypothetical protein